MVILLCKDLSAVYQIRRMPVFFSTGKSRSRSGLLPHDPAISADKSLGNSGPNWLATWHKGNAHLASILPSESHLIQEIMYV